MAVGWIQGLDRVGDGVDLATLCMKQIWMQTEGYCCADSVVGECFKSTRHSPAWRGGRQVASHGVVSWRS